MSVLPVGFGSAVNGGFNVERSLRFNSADSAYLNRTFASAGNRATWTWSAWVKRSFLDATATSAAFQILFHAGTYTTIAFSADSIYFQMANGAGSAWYVQTSQVFRDPSAWYHIVAVLNTPAATASQRMRLYINGVEVTAFSTDQRSSITQSTTSGEINNNISHAIGSNTTPARYFPGYLTEINFIDGQALTPSSFGETDTNTGVWKPKAYSGTYGTNGFYLPFKTASQWSGYFDGTGDKLTSSTNAIAATGQFSVEAWVYQTARTVTSDQHIFSQYTSGATAGRWYLRFNGTTVAFTTGLGTSVSCATTVNTGTWYHVCVTRDSGDRVRVFLNGVLDGTAVISGSLDTAASVIGATQTANYWQGYISNVRAVSGQIPTAYQTASTTVGATIFTPSTSQLTAVSGTSLLTCQSSTFIDNSGLGRTITTAGDVITQQFSPFTLDVTDDHSGQGNHWQPNNLDLRTTGAGADILVDSPTSYGTDTGVGGEVRGNYCTLNPVKYVTNSITYSNGNLQYKPGSSYSTTTYVEGTIGVLGGSTGKYYWEISSDQAGNLWTAGVALQNNTVGSSNIGTTGSVMIYNTSKYVNGTETAGYSTQIAANGVLGIALDAATGKVWFRNSTGWFGSGDPAAGTNETGIITGFSGGTLVPVTQANLASTVTVNFGQRSFSFTAPSGFKALCTQNLPTPTIGATSTTQADNYFSPVLYTGTGSTRSITSLEFQPDFTWIKPRSAADYHILYDAVRGVRKQLYTSLTNAEETETQGLSAFLSNGFTVGGAHTVRGQTNDSGVTYVAWNWKANGAGVTNTDGTITSTVSASTTSGFSIVTYTGNGSANQTVGHGLGVAPAFGILKDRDTNSNNNQWQVFHTGAGDNYAYLSTTAAFTGTAEFYPTSGSSTTVTVGRGSPVATTNESGDRFVMYLFADVEGYSKAFSYASNNTSDNAFVYLGFRPRWIMIKSESTGGVNFDWVIYDTARMTYNYIANTELRANLTTTEGGLARNPAIDILSNGFKVRSSAGEIGSSTLYVGMAFAETPFKYSLAR